MAPTLQALERTNKRLQLLKGAPLTDENREVMFQEVLKLEGINEKDNPTLVEDLRTSGGQEAVLNPFVSEVGQGASLGALDEGIGLVSEEAQAANRAQMNVFQEESPGASLAGQVVGGLAANIAMPGVGMAGTGANVLRRAGKLRTLAAGAARGGGLGLLEGAIAGHNVGRGGLLSKDRLESGLEGAKFGGAVGAGGGAFGNFLRRQLGGTGSDVAAREVVLSEMQRAGIDPSEINTRIGDIRAKTGGAQGMVADLDPSLQQFGQDVGVESAATKRAAIPVMRERDLGAHPRLERRIKATFGRSGGEDFDDFMTARVQAAKDGTKDLYAQSLPTPVRLNATQRAILNDPEIRSLVRNKSAKFHSTRTAPDIYDPATGNVRINPNMNVDDIHAIQQAIGDLANTEGRAGAKGGTGVLWRDRKTLMEAGFDATRQPDGTSLYKTATEIFAGETQLREASERGFKVLTQRPGQIRVEMQNMNAGEREAYKVGVLEALVDTIDRRRDTTDTTLGLVDSPKMRKRIREVFGDQADFDDLVDGISQEADLRQTLNVFQKGSNTVDKLGARKRMREEIAGAELDLAGGFDIAVAGTDPSSSFFAIRRVLQNLGEKFSGAPRSKRISAVLDKVGEVLYNPDRGANAKVQKLLVAQQKRNARNARLDRLLKVAPLAGAGTAAPELTDTLIP